MKKKKLFIIGAVLIVAVVVAIIMTKRSRASLPNNNIQSNLSGGTGTSTNSSGGVIYLNKDKKLYSGTQSEEVREVQKLLNNELNSNLVTDSILGSQTELALDELGIALPTSLAEVQMILSLNWMGWFS